MAAESLRFDRLSSDVARKLRASPILRRRRRDGPGWPSTARLATSEPATAPSKDLAAPSRHAASVGARYGLAAASVACALLLTLALQPFQDGRPTLFAFFAAILVSAWLGGMGPGGLAVALSLPACLYFYAVELHSTAISVNSFVLSFPFALCAAAGGFLNAQQRQAAEGLRKAHREVEHKARELQATNERLVAQMAERRRAEQALREAQAELMRVARLTTMGELSASIAHEVNQPLTAVVANAGSCVRWLDASRPNIEEARAAALRIARDAARACEVIGNVRAMVRGGPPKKTLLDINETIAGLLRLLDNEIQAQGIVVEAELAQGLPALRGDRVQLQQLFLNVLMNAIEAMAVIPPRRRVLRVRTRLERAELRITVQDTGQGIPLEAADRLFEAFVTTKPQGTGLGLSICRTIVEAHGGTISAGPAIPCGAAFDIRLPFDGDR